jgi:hypothetical protein
MLWHLCEEARNQKSEIRRQETGDRSQEPEARSQKRMSALIPVF